MRNLNGTTRFFVFCSGADANWLSRCPEKEVWRYYGIGSLIFMTAFLAFISSSYSFYSIFSIEPNETLNPEGKQIFTPFVLIASLSLGFVWSMFIFFIDRFIVSTISKSDSVGTQIAMAIPRLLIASLISLTLSQPVEIWIFHQRIYHTTKFIADAAVDRKVQAEKSKLATIEVDKIKFDSMKVAKIEAENSSNPVASRANALLVEFNAMNRINQDIEIQIKKGRDKIESIRSDLFMPGEKRDSAIQVLDTQINNRNSAIAKNWELYWAHERASGLLESIRQADHIKSLSTIDQHVTLLKEAEKLALKEKELREAIEKKTNRIAFSENIITQLESLHGYLDGIDVPPGDTKERERRKSMQIIFFVIVLLFFLFESSPVIAKLIIPGGEYDIIANYEKETLRAELASKHNRLTIEYKREEEDHKRRSDFNHFFFDSNKEEDVSLYNAFLLKIREDRENYISTVISDHKKNPVSLKQLYRRLSHQFFHELPIQDIHTEVVQKGHEVITKVSDVKESEVVMSAEVVKEAKAIEVVNLLTVKGKKATSMTFFRGIFVWSKWRKDIDDVWDDSRKDFIKDGLKLAGYSLLYLTASAITAHYTNIAVAGSGSFILIILQFLSNRSKSEIQETVGMPDKNIKS